MKKMTDEKELSKEEKKLAEDDICVVIGAMAGVARKMKLEREAKAKKDLEEN